MKRRLCLTLAAFLTCFAATSAAADPVKDLSGFRELLELPELSANPHFGSKLLFEMGISHDAGLHLGWSKQSNNLSVSGPTIEFMGAPEVCQGPPPQVVSAPEPASMLLLGSGLVGIGAMFRRARKRT